MVPVTRKALLRFHPNPRELRESLLLLPEHRLVYVRVPKAACTTLKLWLHRIHVGDPAAPLERVHAEHQVPTAPEVGWDRVCRMLEGEAFRFTFVRNPLGRAQSAFRNRILSMPGGKWQAQLRRVLDRPEGELTFDHFLSALEATDPAGWNRHWRPQHLITMHGLVSYDFVGRLESFDADLAHVQEQAGLPPVPVESRGKPTRGDSLYDGRPDRRRRVEALYAGDFEAYGY